MAYAQVSEERACVNCPFGRIVLPKILCSKWNSRHRIGDGIEGVPVEVIWPLESGNLAPRIRGPIDEGEVAAPHVRQEIRKDGRRGALPGP